MGPGENLEPPAQRQARWSIGGTVRPRPTSNGVWTLKKPKLCELKGSTPTIPRSLRR
jgi:hypothetical protein